MSIIQTPKRYAFILDSTLPSIIPRMSFVAGDKGSNVLIISLTEILQPYPLTATGTIVNLFVKKTDGIGKAWQSSTEGSITITDANDGIIEIVLASGTIDTVGANNNCEINIQDGNGNDFTFPKFNFTVVDNYANNIASGDTLIPLFQATIDANNATVNANNAEALRVIAEGNRVIEYQNMINTSKMILKNPVATYSSITTTYPTPQIYWTVRTIDDGKLYRYNGTTWEWIDTLNVTVYDTLVNKIGDLSTLSTTNKTSLVNAVNENSSQLANIVSQSKPNGADQTEELNTYFDYLGGKGIKYANLNNTGQYLASGDLTSLHKILMRGNAKISKVNPNNWFANISSALASFNGKINFSGIQSMAGLTDQGVFNQFKIALSQNRPPKFAFIGDSITATSSETLETNTRVAKTTTNSQTIAANGITTDCTYSYALMDMLKDAFPGTTFLSNNYAVGGTRIDAWDTTVTYWGITKKWIDFCKDASPDVLVVAFGMNNNNFDNARLFANDLKNLIDYTKTWTIIPDIIVVTAPRCVYGTNNDNFQSYENQGGRFMAANVARAIAKEYGAYCCDAGRLSDIKRVGLDFTRPIMKRMALADFRKSLYDCTDNGDGSFTVLPTKVGGLYLYDNYLKDFTMKIKLHFTAPVASDSNVLCIAFNKTRVTNYFDNRFNVFPRTASNVAKLTTGLRVADLASWGNSGTTGTYNDSVSYDGIDVTLIISKRADKVEIRKVGDYGLEYVCIQDYADTCDVQGFFQLQYEPSGAGNTLTIKSIEMNGAEYPEYLPTLTENQMFGGFVEGDATYATKMPYGGSGVNHPSSIGIEECYIPPLQEMVNDMVDTVKNSNRNADYGLFPVTQTMDSAPAVTGYSSIVLGSITNYPIFSARLVSAGGTVYKLNKTFIGPWNSTSEQAKLGTNEFGMYNASGTVILLIKATSAVGWLVTSYRKG